MINIIFLFIYFAASNFLSGSDLYVVLTVHFVILAIQYLNEKKLLISPIFIYYLGIILVNIANIVLINKILHNQQTTIYTYIIPKYIDDAAQIWCVSSTMFVIGYNIYITRSLPSIAIILNKKKHIDAIFYIIFVLTLATFTSFGFGRNQIGKIIGLLNSIGILFFARLWGKRRQ